MTKMTYAEKAQHYRNRAHHARAFAASAHSSSSRQALLLVADDYDTLANHFEAKADRVGEISLASA